MIEVVPYNPEWPAQFEAKRRILQSALASWLVGNIQHVGSTSVVGLCAKPVIDIMVPVASLQASELAIPAAITAGYVYYPYQAEVMHWFCKPSPSVRTHHLHLVPLASPLWRERLAFRDALRGSSRLSNEYCELKLKLAQRYKDDREAYTEAKGPFVQRVLAQAQFQQAGAT